MKKWKLISELIERIGTSGINEIIVDWPENLEPICYAPRIGYNMWIFEYKGLKIAMRNMSNGWWRFYSAVTWLDVLLAKYDEWKARRSK